MTKSYKIKELYKILRALIDDGYGDKEFQVYYNNEKNHTSIPKGSRVLVFSKAIRFTDKDDGEIHINDLEEILKEEL